MELKLEFRKSACWQKTPKGMMIFHSTDFQPSENAFGRICANMKIQIRSRRYLDADYFVPKLITVLGWFGLVDRPTQLICISDIYLSIDKYKRHSRAIC